PAASVSQASRVSPAGWDFSVLLDAGVEGRQDDAHPRAHHDSSESLRPLAVPVADEDPMARQEPIDGVRETRRPWLWSIVRLRLREVRPRKSPRSGTGPWHPAWKLVKSLPVGAPSQDRDAGSNPAEATSLTD